MGARLQYHYKLSALDVHRNESASGALVRRLVDRELLGAGDNQSRWDLRDEAGRPVASSSYLYRLTVSEASAERTLSGRMAVVR